LGGEETGRIDFLKFKGHYANRINTQGQAGYVRNGLTLPEMLTAAFVFSFAQLHEKKTNVIRITIYFIREGFENN
jgi:hypothetical protein